MSTDPDHTTTVWGRWLVRTWRLEGAGWRIVITPVDQRSVSADAVRKIHSAIVTRLKGGDA